MKDNFIEMIYNIDFLYGFIYECTDLRNYLYNHNDYDHLVIKLCDKFVFPIINITKNEHVEEYNTYIKNAENINSICSSYLMDICSEEYFELSRNEYLKIKEFMNNNIDTIESMLPPMHEFFDLHKECYNHCNCTYSYYSENDFCKCKKFCEGASIALGKIVKSYFNVEYIKFFYLLQKNIEQIIFKKLNLYTENKLILVNMFINLYDNSNIDCNKKVESKICDLYDVMNRFAFA